MPLHEQVRHLPAIVDAGQVDTLVLRGMTGSGRRTTLGAIARTLGRDLLLFGGEGSAPEGLGARTTAGCLGRWRP